MNVLTAERASEMEATVKADVAKSIEFARNSPFPTDDAGLTNVYAQGAVSPSQFA
jgi:TPP-dependent pyruvate/acetoin dehydrogenase alpha subunit